MMTAMITVTIMLIVVMMIPMVMMIAMITTMVLIAMTIIVTMTETLITITQQYKKNFPIHFGNEFFYINMILPDVKDRNMDTEKLFAFRAVPRSFHSI